ncbi:MAG TPA: hypothetical protein VIK52_11185, partial [Opitutaceae bacterium]
MEPRILLSASAPEAALEIDEQTDRFSAREVISISSESAAQTDSAEAIDIFGEVDGAVALENVSDSIASEESSVEYSVVVGLQTEPANSMEPQVVPESDPIVAMLVETLNAAQGPPGSDPVVQNETLDATITWLGGTGDWHVGANWSGGVAPGASDLAIINSGTAIVRGSRTVGGLEVGVGGTLLIRGDSTFSTGSLTVSNPWTNHGTVEITSIQAGHAAQLLGAAVT